MRNSRLTMIGFLLCGVLAFAPNSWAQQRAPILDQIAKTYGIDSWDQVEAIRYTWNADITGLFKAAHKWEWEPKTNKVSFEGTDKDGKPVKVSYVRTDLSTQSDDVKNEVDPSFINDNYWTLFPFHAYWDKSASAIDQGKFNLPLGPGMAELLPIKYPAEGGYTPGDTWDLTSVKTTASCTLSTTAAGPSRRAESSQRGQATKRQVQFCSQPSIAAPPTASRCTFGLQTWRSS